MVHWDWYGETKGFWECTFLLQTVSILKRSLVNTTAFAFPNEGNKSRMLEPSEMMLWSFQYLWADSESCWTTMCSWSYRQVRTIGALRRLKDFNKPGGFAFEVLGRRNARKYRLISFLCNLFMLCVCKV